jgi:hypothetical protein
MQDQIAAAIASQEAPEAAERLTPKQITWTEHKATQRAQRRSLRYLGYLGIPRRLRERVSRLAARGKLLERLPEKSTARVPRGRLSNSTALP